MNSTPTARLKAASFGVGLIVLAPGRPFVQPEQLKVSSTMPITPSSGAFLPPVAHGGKTIKVADFADAAGAAVPISPIDEARTAVQDFFAELEQLDLPWWVDDEELAVDAADFEAAQISVLHNLSD